MRLYLECIKLCFRKFLLRQNTGTVIRKACSRLGIVYIKFAQILATQNYGDLFTEDDRQKLSEICDSCNPIPFSKIKIILEREYGDLSQTFSRINPQPIGSASVSQVHQAWLISGEEVALKIKRQDIAANIARDIARLKRLVHRFGPLINFNNYGAGDHALDMFLAWISEETDFRREQTNLRDYQAFAEKVNGHIRDSKKIVTPKLYPEYCTDNVIVMEFIHHQTINQLKLSEPNKQRIRTAINSYFKNSFYALFNDIPVIFHGDPHGGNIYIDEQGNVGFLDFGLTFRLTEDNCQLVREFFLAAYSGDGAKLFQMLAGYSNLDSSSRERFYHDCCDYCINIRSRDVTSFFTDMINICLGYEVDPPGFLFAMAKAFVCLNGVNNFSENKIDCVELLNTQVMTYLIRRGFQDGVHLLVHQTASIKRVLAGSIKDGPLLALAREFDNQKEFRQDTLKFLDTAKYLIRLGSLM